MAEPNSSRAASGGSASRMGATGNGDQRDGSLAGKVRERATATLESQKSRATDGLGSVARAVRNTEEQLRSQHHESIADYVSQVADQIDRFSQQLRDKRVNELFDDAQHFARRHPAAFAGSAFALGVVAARFLKSSGDRSYSSGDYDEESRSGEFRGAAKYGDDDRPRAYGDRSTSGTGASSWTTGASQAPAFGTPSTAPGSTGSTAAGSFSSGSTADRASATGQSATTGQTGRSNAGGTASGTGPMTPSQVAGTRGRRSGSGTERS